MKYWLMISLATFSSFPYVETVDIYIVTSARSELPNFKVFGKLNNVKGLGWHGCNLNLNTYRRKEPVQELLISQ